MKTKRHGFLTIIMVMCMILQSTLTYAAATLDSNGIPTEVSGNEYVEIPIKQNGKVISSIKQTMQKGTSSGQVVIYVKAYAYKTGNQIKTSTMISYLAADGTMPTEFFDQIGTYSLEEIGWPSCSGFYIEPSKELEFSGPNDNEKRVKVTLKTSLGDEFYRYTEKDVAFSTGLDGVVLSTLNGGTDEIDTYSTTLDSSISNENKKVFDEVMPVKKDSTIKVSLDITASSLSKDPQYQVITSDTEPKLPVTGGVWEKLADLSSVTSGTKKYEDLIETPNRLTVQHYLYAPGFEKSPAAYGDAKRDRAEVFKYPIDGTIQQSTTLGNNTTYSTQEGDPAFFLTSWISDQTELTATFVPSVSGEYRFCVYSATGAYGTITVNGAKKVFVDNWNTYNSEQPYYHTNANSFHLEAGKEYTVYLKTRHRSNRDTAPCFMYAVKPAGGWPQISGNGAHSIKDNKHTTSCYRAAEEKLWQIVTPTLLKNQKPSNGSNRAAKLWGFIVPDVSGEFNFGLYADDGAYGYIVVDDKAEVFVDSFGLSRPTDQSNDVKISIKAGEPYPFYLEWYEGCPNEQALAPRYKEANSGKWKDIPGNWFRPSSNLSVAQIPLAMYEGSILDKEIPIPNTKGEHYIALKVTDKDGTEHQVLYGPFTVAIGDDVVELPPTGSKENNYVVPESISNVSAKVTYNTPAKKVVYTVDLQEICDLQLGGQAVFQTLDLSKAIIEVTDTSGKEIVSSSSTKYETSIVGNELIIKVKDEEAIINNGESHKINIYFPTSFGSGIVYYKSTTTSQTYMDLLDVLKDPTSEQVEAQLTVSRCPKIREAVKVNGVIIAEEEYASIPTTHTIDIILTLRQMPSIH